MTRKLHSILLVDDNEADNYFHHRVLQKSGFAGYIGFAGNGQEALDHLAACDNPRPEPDAPPRPDLVLLDLNMPMVNGWEFLEAYLARQAADNPSPIVVVLTTSLNPADKVKAESLLGPGTFYHKPLTAAMLDEIRNRFFG